MGQFFHHLQVLLVSSRFSIGAALLASVLFTAPAFATMPSCTQGSEFEPPLCPLHLPPIDKILIEETGFNAWGESDHTDCSQFTLTQKQIAAYLIKSKAADLHDIHYTLSESPCQVVGQVNFKNGAIGHFRIDQLRVGRLSQAGQEDRGLYCKACNFAPFDEQ